MVIHHLKAAPGRAKRHANLLVLAAVALVAISYVQVQHFAVHTQTKSWRGASGGRRLSQRASVGPADDVVLEEAPVHGFVRKAGMTALANWHMEYAELRKAQFRAWMEQKGSVLNGSMPDGLNLLGVKPPYVLPFHNGRGCNIYYNEKYKVIFLRTQKVASTTTMAFFGECANEPNRPTCLKPLWEAPPGDALQLRLMWSNFFVFGWSRNPWARAVSSYQYLLHAVKDEPQCDRVDWDTFCGDPLVFGELCKAQPECCPHFNHIFMAFHVNDQTTCLTTDSGEWAADYIGRSERFKEDFPIILREINRRLPEGVPHLSLDAQPESQNTNEVVCSDDDREPQERRPGETAAAAAAGSGSGGSSDGSSSDGSSSSSVGGVAPAAAAAAAAAVGQQGAAGDGAAPAAGTQAAPQEAAASASGGQQEAAAAAEGQQPAAAAGAETSQPAGAEGQQQEQQQQQQQAGAAAAAAEAGGGEGAGRRLLYSKLEGFLFAEENYCDKRKFFTGRHAACFDQIARFYGSDLQRLGFKLQEEGAAEPVGLAQQ